MQCRSPVRRVNRSSVARRTSDSGIPAAVDRAGLPESHLARSIKSTLRCRRQYAHERRHFGCSSKAIREPSRIALRGPRVRQLLLDVTGAHGGREGCS